MSSPFIFIATNRLKPGKLDDERKRVPGLVEFIESNEPRLIGARFPLERAAEALKLIDERGATGKVVLEV